MINSEFFRAKRSWSKYKDFILQYYLEPYIPKVARLNKPIFIVDCFAGCGKFEDGEPGSPLIIADAIRHWHERSNSIVISGEFIEADPENFRLLQTALSHYKDLATPYFGRFEDRIGEIAQRAKSETVFLYVDPYTVKGLVFDRMKAVYDQIHKSRASVEVLINFNVATFMRWALAALKRVNDLPLDAINEDADYQADDPNERLEIASLNAIAGGEYWQGIAKNDMLPFVRKLEIFTDLYAVQLRESFEYVCTYPVKSKYEHQTPKYMLVYATRHSDGLELMNDAMCNARRQFLGSQFQTGMLFDMTPSREVEDTSELKRALLDIVAHAGQISRKKVRLEVLKSFFCRFENKDLNKAVGELLKSGQLRSASGKARINDQELLSVPSAQTDE